MPQIRFSVIVHMEGANREFFKDFLQSLAGSTYKEFELVITDSSGIESNGTIASEFFPEKGKLTYRQVRPGRTRGYALNYAISLAKGEAFLIFDRHSRVSPIALMEMAKAMEDGADLCYSDNDELIGDDRMNPDFKCGANASLIRQRNYIGDIFAIKRSAITTTGLFRDTLKYAVCYELLLRAFEKKLNIVHIAKSLYSKRVVLGNESQDKRSQRVRTAYMEHVAAASAHLRRQGIEGEVKPARSSAYWNVVYDGSDYRSHRGEYICVRDKNVRTRLRDAIPKMYGHLKQPDVGIVGGMVLRNLISYDNCGFIFDTSGICYPACHGQSVFYDGYNYRCILSSDVSLVDFGFCLIKKKVFKGLNGFDKTLSGKEMMLDFCLRAKRHGYRTVYEPSARGTRRNEDYSSDLASTERLGEKWKDVLEAGDPFYNKNLPMGLDNYFLY